MRLRVQWLVVGAVAILVGSVAMGLLGAEPGAPECDKLAVLWSSGDPDVGHKVCLMYTHAAKRAGWFDEVELIVWGPSSRLLAADKELQAKVKAMMAQPKFPVTE